MSRWFALADAHGEPDVFLGCAAFADAALGNRLPRSGMTSAGVS